MPSFKIVTKPEDLNIPADYEAPKKFDSRDQTVSHSGREYTLTHKKQRDFSLPERTGRAALGILAVMGTFGLGLINKDFRKFVGNLFFKEKKSTRYATPLDSTQTMLTRLTGNLLQTDEKLIEQFCMDYNGLQAKAENATQKNDPRINIEGTVINLPNIKGVTNRDLDKDKIPKKIEEIIPEQLKSYFGDAFSPEMARTLALLLQQGIGAEIMGKFLEKEILNNDNFDLFFNTYPYFTFYKDGAEFFVSIKQNCFRADHPSAEHKIDYSATTVVNLTNPYAPVQRSCNIVLQETTARALEELTGKDLVLDNNLISQYAKDLSTLQGEDKDANNKPQPRIKIENKAITIPNIKGVGGRHISAPDKLPKTIKETLPPDLIKYFEEVIPHDKIESTARNSALWLQQGSSHQLLESFVQFIQPGNKTGDGYTFQIAKYPFFNFYLNKKKELILSIESEAFTRPAADDNTIPGKEPRTYYMLTMTINLSDLESREEIQYTFIREENLEQ